VLNNWPWCYHHVSAACSHWYVGAMFVSHSTDLKYNSCVDVPAGLEFAVTVVPAAVPCAVSAWPRQR